MSGAFADLVETELGTAMSRHLVGHEMVREFFEKAKVQHVMDGITLFGRAYRGWGTQANVNNWYGFCERVMRELGMRYRVAADGLVHFHIDTAFQATGTAAVTSLSAPKYAGAAAAIQHSIGELNKLGGSPKTAIREVFEGVESAFKVALKTNGNLGQKEIGETLQPEIDRLFSAADIVQRGAATQVVQSMKDWANAAHKYRHGHGLPDPVEPSRTLAIALVSMGIAFGRFIGETFP